MWPFTRKSKDRLDPLLQRFKDIMDNPRCLEWFENVASGLTRNLPIDVAGNVQEAIDLSNSITAMATIDANTLIRAIKSDNLDSINDRITKSAGAVDDAALAEDELNPKTLEGIMKLLKKHGNVSGGKILERSADNGNTLCQIFIYQGCVFALPTEHQTAEIKRKGEHYMRLAATAGDAEAQFNLGLYCGKKVDGSKDFLTQEDLSHIREAEMWHRKAASQNFEAAVKILIENEGFFRIGNRQR
jgi:TPR repeat protein